MTSYPDYASSEYLLFTDGSGHQDKFGGYASLVIANYAHSPTKMACCVGGAFGTSVERMEFTGLLEGLQSILDTGGYNKSAGHAELAVRRPHIAWFTDRESLALSCWMPDGVPFYRRKSCPDLWARYEWYEQFFTIIPIWCGRTTHAAQDVSDKLASEARVLVKDWIMTLHADGRFPNVLGAPPQEATRHVPTGMREAPTQPERPGEFGMWAGPVRDLLETAGTKPDDVIIRYNADGTDEVLWRRDGGLVIIAVTRVCDEWLIPDCIVTLSDGTTHRTRYVAQVGHQWEPNASAELPPPSGSIVDKSKHPHCSANDMATKKSCGLDDGA